MSPLCSQVVKSRYSFRYTLHTSIMRLDHERLYVAVCVRLLEAAIGVEPMNKGFAVLIDQFHCVQSRSLTSYPVQHLTLRKSLFV